MATPTTTAGAGASASAAAAAASAGTAIICPGHSRPVPDCAYSKDTGADGYFLISSCLDGKPMMREGATGDWIGTFVGHKGAVWSTRLNEDATKAVTASADFSSKLWNACTGKEMYTWEHKHIVKTSLFTDDGKRVVTAGAEKKIRIFDLQRPDAEPQMWVGGENTISHASTCPDPNLLVSVSREKHVQVWDMRTLKVAKTLVSPSPVNSLTRTNDGSCLSATADNDVLIWDATSFELLKTFHQEREQNCVAYSPSQHCFVTGSDKELWVRVYDFDTGAELACNKGHHGPVRCVSFSPDGSSYCSGSEDGTIRIWNTQFAKTSGAAAAAAAATAASSSAAATPAATDAATAST